MEFYSADLEMLMSGWNTLHYHDSENGVGIEWWYPIESGLSMPIMRARTWHESL
jgi:hypothetical protein